MKIGVDKAKCNLCQKEINCKAGNTTSMSRHASTQHNDQWTAFKEKALNQPTLKRFFRGPQYKTNSKRRQIINRKVAEFIARDMRPFSVVEGSGFKNLLKEMDPCYVLPTRKTISSKLIPRLHAESMIKLLEELKTVKDCAVTTDGWTSMTGDKFNAFTIHFIDWSSNEPELKSKILECAPFEADRGTSEEIEKELERVAEKFQIKNKLVLTVADNAPDVQKALKLFGIPKLGCIAHKLNLAAQYAIDSHDHVVKLRGKLTRLAKFMKRSSGAKKAFAKCLKTVGITGKSSLVSYVKTRWNCVYEMFQRAREFKDALTLFFAEFKNDVLNEDDFKLIEEILPILRPLYLVTLELSGEKITTLSKVVPLVNLLQQTYSKEYDEKKRAKDFRQKVLEALKLKLKPNEIEQEKVFGNSTILDPRFKTIPFSNKTIGQQAVSEAKSHAVSIALAIETNEKAENEIEIQVDNMPSTSKNKDEFDELWSSFDAKPANPSKTRNKGQKKTDYRKTCIDLEMQKYLALPKLDRRECPIKWWKTVGSKQFFYLFEAAKPYLCMPATSVPSERFFSSAGYIINKKRSSLSKRNANMLITLHQNLN